MPQPRLVGARLVDFIVEVDRPRVLAKLGEATDGGVPVELAVSLASPGGEPLQIGLRVAADPSDGARDVRLRWSLRDRSERLQLEREREELQEELDLVLAMADVSRLTAGADPLPDVLAQVVELATGAVDGSVSITLRDPKDRLRTAAASDDDAGELSDHQHAHGGPCPESARTGATFHLPVDALLTSWTDLAGLLADRGFAEVLAFPLESDGQAVGAVNVYARQPVGGAQHRTLQLLTAQAAGAIGNAQLFRSASELAAQLTSALEHRASIEQAKGLLMALQRCDQEQAFEVLRRASQRQNRKLWIVAQELVERSVQEFRSPRT